MRQQIPIYPFAAIVGQERMKLALTLNIINPALSGVLIRGEKGTAKSTAVRALAHILPEIEVFVPDPFRLDPRTEGEMWPELQKALGVMNPPEPLIQKSKIKVVELPVGATEDRLVGSLDLEKALKTGQKRVEPGLLAAAHRGVLYVDEVNLLDDHLVDVLLDSAAMGVSVIEREGVSFSHPARFTLVGTMNPEEGELRPQLLDRFGLCVNIAGVLDLESRVAVLARRSSFEDNPESFEKEWANESAKLSQAIQQAQKILPQVKVSQELLYHIATICLEVGVDGHRGDIIIHKAAKTLAAYEGRLAVTKGDIAAAAELALPHRIRRQPLQAIADNLDQVKTRVKAL
ncbi:MAG: ATP-binding protein [Deltaproteobacteria bacterium]|jgi:magnesium chelatase subunit I|nr:ATP-binding protein [Deltaproteobacteria bacterium]